MVGASRSHSPPLPPNATYNHPVISLNILPSAKLFVAGSKVTGMLEVTCKERNSVALGQLAIEFFGIEELKLLDHTAQSSIHGPHKCVFQGPALPPSNAVASSEAPIGGHYYTALRGRTKFPFSFPLPSNLPSSTDFDGKARVSYALKATCQVLTIQSRQNVSVTKSLPIQIVEKLVDWNDAKYHDCLEVRGEQAASDGVGVWAEAKIDKRLYYHQHSSSPNDGLIPVQLTVKNNSRRALSGGVSAKICRRLVLPNDSPPSNDSTRIQIVRNCSFRGVDYEFPPVSGQAKTVKLICQLPSPSQGDKCNADHELSYISIKGTKLFSVDMFLRVEIELGALSNDLIVDLPIYVTHPSSLPKELLVRNATPLTIDHIPSSNPMSIAHLSEPQSSGRISRNISRSPSPHPPSLQPGNISRSASPRLSLNVGSDWGIPRSAPPSPGPLPHFSPLPTPRHSPLPSPRFSSPLPFSPGSAIPNHQSSVPNVMSSTSYFSPSTLWSNSAATPYPVDHASIPSSPGPGFYPPVNPHGFSAYSQPQSSTPLPIPDNHPLVAPGGPQHPQSTSQPFFSPPTTPWRRQTISTLPNFDPSSAYSCPTPQPDRPYQPTPQPSTPMSHFPIQNYPVPPPVYPHETFAPSPYPGADSENPTRSHWRTRHQSLPVAPAPPQNYSYHHSSDHDQGNCLDNPSGLCRKHSNSSRRTSEPLPNQPLTNAPLHSQSNSGTMMAMKRALPTLPQAYEIDHSQDHPNYNIAVSSSEQSNSNQYSRLETIGEVGESRPGTLSNKLVSPEILDSLVNSECLEGDDFRPCQPRQAARIASHPRGMRPRISDANDSIPAPEDVVSYSDERQSFEEGSDFRQTPPDGISIKADQHPTFEASSLRQNECMTSVSGPLSSQSDSKSNLQPYQSSPRHSESISHSTRESSSPSPSRLASSHRNSQPTHPKGLANLAQLLTRATSTEPPRALSTSGTNKTSRDSSLDAQGESNNSMNGKLLQATGPSNYSGSALRMKSTRISYGEAFVDAVPSPTVVNSNSIVDPEREKSIDVDKSVWKLPPASVNQSSHTPRSSIVEHIDLSNDLIPDNPPLKRESIAPDALFPQLELDDSVSASGNANSPLKNIPEKIPSTSTAPKDRSSLVQQQPSGNPEPLLIPSDSPLVKKKSPKSSKKVNQSQQPTEVLHLNPSPPLNQVQTSSPPPHRTLNDSEFIGSSSQMTIVERLRSQNQEIHPKATDQFEIREFPTAQAGFAVVTGEQVLQKSLTSLHDAEIQVQEVDHSGAQAENEILPVERNTSNRVSEDASKQRSANFEPQSLAPSRRPPQPTSLQPSFASNRPLATGTSSTVSQVGDVTFPLFSRLSAIPKSTTPLSIRGSGVYNASELVPHRPLPICLGNSQMINSLGVNQPSTPDSAVRKPLVTHDSQGHVSPRVTRDPTTETNLNIQRPDYINPENHTNHTNKLMIDTQTSPTSLARKSRIKRQSSSNYTSLEKMMSYNNTGDKVLSFDRVSGGWNEEESNEIEAELMEALRQTNLAVQKATSHRLSTPQFSKSTILSNLLSKSQTRRSSFDRGSRLEIERASMTFVDSDRDDGYDRRNSVDHDLCRIDGLTIHSPTKMIDETLQEIAYDEDKPIPLTSGEYKSMRGGRGGRVSSVVGQWAKLTAADESGVSISRKNPESIAKRDRNSKINSNDAEPNHHDHNQLLISTRGISIKPRKDSNQSTRSYSITGFLSRTSSLASQSSSSITKANTGGDLTMRTTSTIRNRLDRSDQHDDDHRSKKLPIAPKFNPPNLTSGPRTLPPTLRSTSTIMTTSTNEDNINKRSVGISSDSRNSNQVNGYRNLANRLSVTTNHLGSITPSSSSSISSVSSTSFDRRTNDPLTTRTTTASASVSRLGSSMLDRGKRHSTFFNNLSTKSNSTSSSINNRHTNRNSTNTTMIGAGISDLVKRWEN